MSTINATLPITCKTRSIAGKGVRQVFKTGENAFLAVTTKTNPDGSVVQTFKELTSPAKKFVKTNFNPNTGYPVRQVVKQHGRNGNNLTTTTTFNEGGKPDIVQIAEKTPNNVKRFLTFLLDSKGKPTDAFAQEVSKRGNLKSQKVLLG